VVKFDQWSKQWSNLTLSPHRPCITPALLHVRFTNVYQSKVMQLVHLIIRKILLLQVWTTLAPSPPTAVGVHTHATLPPHSPLQPSKILHNPLNNTIQLSTIQQYNSKYNMTLQLPQQPHTIYTNHQSPITSPLNRPSQTLYMLQILPQIRSQTQRLVCVQHHSCL
jgi:hypothetical protein